MTVIDTHVLTEHEVREVGRKAQDATLRALEALGGEARREEIRKRALQLGDFTDRELQATPPPAGQKFERLVDYRLSWALTNLKRDGLVENPSWGVWRLMTAAEPDPLPLVEAVVSQSRLAELHSMPYHRYLRSPEWKLTRAAALERAGHRCSLDASHADALDVHHNTYERRGAELPSDVVVLCRPCHELHHGEYGRARRPADPDARSTSVAGLLHRLIAR